jgi:hypothetical protein
MLTNLPSSPPKIRPEDIQGFSFHEADRINQKENKNIKKVAKCFGAEKIVINLRSVNGPYDKRIEMVAFCSYLDTYMMAN